MPLTRSRLETKSVNDGKKPVGGVVTNVEVGSVVGGGCRAGADVILDEPLTEETAAYLRQRGAARVEGSPHAVALWNVKPGASKIAISAPDTYLPDQWATQRAHDQAVRDLDGKRFTA
jgi:hypothetical protein